MAKFPKRSVWGLNLVNFFLAQIADVVVPFLSVFMREHHWRYDQIGWATSVSGAGSLIFQLPAGLICDRMGPSTKLLAAMAVLLGASYFFLWACINDFTLTLFILFISGAAGTFFAPLLAGIALSLSGTKRFPLLVGKNRSFNHAGNFAAALVALLVARAMGIGPLFFVAAAVSLIAALCTFLIRKRDLTHGPPRPKKRPAVGAMVKQMLTIVKKPLTRNLLISIVLFHFANAPLGALVSLYLKHSGGTDAQVAWLVLVAQPVMIPMAWLAGRASSKIGRKPVLSLAFLILPVRILLYTMTSDPLVILAITALDGIVSAIFGVLLVLISNDLTGGRAGFNSLLALVCMMPAVGAALGSIVSGYLVEQLGFHGCFGWLAAFACVAALFFIARFKETSKAHGFDYESITEIVAAERG